MGAEQDKSDGLDGLMRALARAPDVASVPSIVVSRGELRVVAIEPVETPAAIGSFEVVGVLGAGGMGVVYEAIDATLKRKVAIKVLRVRGSSQQAPARLLREAQALAQLSHPNVVTVYEARREDDRVYLVMELVRGVDARDWRSAAPRTRSEIIDVYRQAARGLSVAHERGLVHRDVKPENILVGDDGRVRIGDFGLVAGLGDESLAEAVVHDERVETLTQTGTVLGTLPYIAPEAHEGRDITPRADQWSLCVSLWEAIAGVRPHTGATYAETIDAIRGGRLERGRANIPGAIRAVLERGLAVDPAARWPSLDALFTAIARAPRRRFGRIVALSLAGIAVAGGLAAGAWRSSQHHAHAPVAVRITEPGGCPYSPVFVGDAIVFDDGNGDLWSDAHGVTRSLVAGPTNDWRANRGRRPGEVVFVSADAKGNHAGFVDIATGRVESAAIDSASFAIGGGMTFYDRIDVAEVRRVRDGEDQRAVAMPDGRWPYTVAASADGRRLAITTALDRSAPTICFADLDPQSGLARTAPTCLDRDDVIAGRAAFSPDGGTVYYQTATGIRRRDDDGDEMWLASAYAYGGIDVAPDGRALVYSDSHPVDTEIAPADPPGPPVVRGKITGYAPIAGGWLVVRHEDGKSDTLALQTRDGVRVVSPPIERISLGDGVDREGLRATFDVDGPAPGIYVVDLKPYPPVRITTTAKDSNPIWTADGKIAFTRWDADGQPAVILVDPAEGVHDDAARRAAHPMPRITATSIRTTGELVLLGLDGHSVYAWDPKTGKERAVDLRPIALPVLQVSVSPDGRWLAALTDDTSTWLVDLAGGTPARIAVKPVHCGTSDRPAFDEHGRLHVVTRPWRGDLYRVDLD